jgi:hypothetical protein
MIPKFDDCIVCEGIREELHGKMTLVGFLGICPNVDFGLQALDQPAIMMFMLFGGPGDGTYTGWIDILDEATGRVLAATAPAPFIAKPTARTVIGAQVGAIFGHAGTFIIRLFVDGIERFRSTFIVSAVNQSGTRQRTEELERRAVAG